MLIRKCEPLKSKILKSYKTNFLWCSDGWVYDTQSMKRRQYIPIDSNTFELIETSFIKFVFSDVEYSEEVEVKIISENPKIWIENSEMFKELNY